MGTHKITVNINNLRKKAMMSFDRLTITLNQSIAESEKEYGDNMVRVDPDDIQTEMDDLRMLIGSIGGLCIEGDNDFKDVFSEAYPSESSMVCFNEEE
ncbi:hypothetical protein [Pedobacter gandavensis]|uniref:Uncharacterized protein n=1 Tax=Pedobacter gandavensis TaxID=2679963 RepID=A0ABR6EWI8_9SPHI|nr:hypothetical protein [Pedobacter gandavensis]MBB2148798.1 hypothetical protein [Pedobacter gandavensis]